MDEPTRAVARTGMEQLRMDGSPVAWPETTEATISQGWRRWRSFHRRHKRGSDDFEARVEDLAKGLCSAFEEEPRLVGPLMTDYRHLARTLAVVFAQASDTSKGN
ncbi:MAG TPA: hypothetical protein VFH20_12540 [Propionibacteriaceae bacterium]|nr:hypothetical protein [Propionibacteriaceae bacterium]